jgi:hypothetical protein
LNLFQGENVMPRTSFADIATDWQGLLVSVANNKDDLPGLEPYRAQLEVELEGARAASIRQAAAQSEAQQATRDLEGFLQRGKDLADRMRTGIVSKYGRRSEKLAEFRIKPFRSRKKVSGVKAPSRGPAEKASVETSSMQAGEKPAPQDSTTTGTSQ